MMLKCFKPDEIRQIIKILHTMKYSSIGIFSKVEMYEYCYYLEKELIKYLNEIETN